MHLSFVSTTPGRAGIPGGFDNKFVPKRRAFDKKMQPESRAIDKRAKNDETGSQHIKFLKKFNKKFKICRYGEPFCGRCFFIFGG
jgi:hypothetical protein